MSNFKKAREAAGISQKEIALSLHVSQPTVSEWEKGKKTPSGKNLKMLSSLLSCSIDYLLGLADNPTPQDFNGPIYDEEALELMDAMHKRPELKTLFNTTKNVKKEDIEFVDQMIKRMAGYEDDDPQ